MTEYIIFRALKKESDNLVGWVPVARGDARSGASAIRTLLGKSSEEFGGQYVAVPARSWKPVSVSVETKTQLKFS